jgi:hypothetical protein
MILTVKIYRNILPIYNEINIITTYLVFTQTKIRQHKNTRIDYHITDLDKFQFDNGHKST